MNQKKKKGRKLYIHLRIPNWILDRLAHWFGETNKLIDFRLENNENIT